MRVNSGLLSVDESSWASAGRMTFRAYIDNIRAKTGQGPRDFERRAKAKGLLKPDTKPEQIVAWLKEEFGLGYGHALAIYSLLKPKMGKGLRRGRTPVKYLLPTR